MTSGLALVLLVVGSYLAAHVAFDWLARRLVIVSGAEYILLGILLGPQVSGLLTAGMLQDLAPASALALGWMGAIVGSRFLLTALVRVPGAIYRVAFVESLLTMFVVGGAQFYMLRWLFSLSDERALAPAIALGAFATLSSHAGIEVAARRFRERSALVAALRTTTGANAFLAVCTFGILLSFEHAPSATLVRQLTPTEWTVVNVAIGIVGGGLFHLFLGDEKRIDRLFISLGGIIVLVSGAATYLRLSPVMAGMFFGTTLINTTRQRAEVGAALYRIERPLYFVLLVFAGASWRPSAQPAWLLPVLLFVVARITAKIGGARLVARINDLLPVLGNNWGYALLGQGGLIIALAVNYVYADTLALPNVVFTTALVSVLLTDMLSGRFASSAIAPFATAPAASQLERTP
ncbi:MAG: hypothetical protein MNPFHGCM_02738 [Gemmatimonadaceae bacterium]|nr:hypothetical protein [Gemmatimonadaceae bacterium]